MKQQRTLVSCYSNIFPKVENFEKKERDWLGFREALALIGLDADDAKARL